MSLQHANSFTPNDFDFDFDLDLDATLVLPAAPTNGTQRFGHRGFATVEELMGRPSGDGFPTGDFRLVPERMAEKAYEPNTLRWWLELWPDQGHCEAIRLEIVGDVVLGRSDEADVDLTAFNGMHHGISRRHALLRPSRKALYLLDLGSTNGTHCNGIPMGQGIAKALIQHSVLRLGSLNLTVQYVGMTTM